MAAPTGRALVPSRLRRAITGCVAAFAALGVLPSSAVAGNPTSISVSCDPQTVKVGDLTTCTVKVTDTGTDPSQPPSPPLGQISFNNSPASDGKFIGPDSCTLGPSRDRDPQAPPNESTCGVNYEPTAAGSGMQQISAFYLPSDGHNSGAPATFNLSVTDAGTTRATRTSVVCSPDTVRVGERTHCDVTVIDIDADPKTTPAGVVHVIPPEDPPPCSVCQQGFMTNDQCASHLGGAGAESSCSFDYTPTRVAGGVHTITADYDPTDNHAPSRGSGNVTVLGASSFTATTTTVACNPSTVAVFADATCTVTVTGPAGDQTPPSGTASFSSDGSGFFGSAGSRGPGGSSTASCGLAPAANANGASSQCTVRYTPTEIGSGRHTINAVFEGDASHLRSSASATVEVEKRSTAVSIGGCNVEAIDSTAHCLITVQDTSPGVAPDPTGTVSLTSNGEGRFDPARCALSGAGFGRSQCTVDYTPTALGPPPFGHQLLSASYSTEDASGDPQLRDPFHSPSSTTQDLRVARRLVGSQASCSPDPLPIHATATCTVKVIDEVDTPTGTVSLFVAHPGAGHVSQDSCTLSGGTCSFSYTADAQPGPLSASLHGVATVYGGDEKHASNDDPSHEPGVNILVYDPTLVFDPAGLAKAIANSGASLRLFRGQDQVVLDTVSCPFVCGPLKVQATTGGSAGGSSKPAQRAFATASRHHPQRHRVGAVIGAGTVRLGAGQTKHLRFTLNARGKKLLAKRGRLRCQVTVTAHGPNGAISVTKAITIYAAKRHPRR